MKEKGPINYDYNWSINKTYLYYSLKREALKRNAILKREKEP